MTSSRALLTLAAALLALSLTPMATARPPAQPDYAALAAAHAPTSTVERAKVIALARTAWEDGLVPALDALDTLYRETDIVFPERHILAHLIGKVSHLRGDDPGEAYGICASDPSDGCMHSVAQSVLESVPELTRESVADICDFAYRDQRGSDRSDTCWHAFAHLLVEHHKLGLWEMLPMCDWVRRPDGQHWCRDGVFELSFADGDKALTEGWARYDEPLYPCSALTETNAPFCYQKLPLILLHVHGGDVARSGAVCATVPGAYRPNCYYGIGQNTILLLKDDRTLAARVRLCALVGPEGRDDCARGTFNQGTLSAAEIRAVCETMAARPRQQCLQGLPTQ